MGIRCRSYRRSRGAGDLTPQPPSLQGRGDRPRLTRLSPLPRGEPSPPAKRPPPFLKREGGRGGLGPPPLIGPKMALPQAHALTPQPGPLGPFADLVAAIGHTPLVELQRFSPKPGVRIFAKLEG